MLPRSVIVITALMCAWALAITALSQSIIFLQAGRTAKVKHADTNGYSTYTCLRHSYFILTYLSTVSHQGYDVPHRWPSVPAGSVHMPFENTVHFAMDGEFADAEWQALLPRGQGLLSMNGSEEMFSIGMFHQLRCLDIVRSALAEIFRHPEKGTPYADDQPIIVQHCMDYLRQMTICHADLTALSVKDIVGKRGHVEASDVTHTCRTDFAAVYAAAEEHVSVN
jgi:hypothetical protein